MKDKVCMPVQVPIVIADGVVCGEVEDIIVNNDDMRITTTYIEDKDNFSKNSGAIDIIIAFVNEPESLSYINVKIANIYSEGFSMSNLGYLKKFYDAHLAPVTDNKYFEICNYVYPLERIMIGLNDILDPATPGEKEFMEKKLRQEKYSELRIFGTHLMNKYQYLKYKYAFKKEG